MEVYYSSAQGLPPCDKQDTEYIIFTNNEKNDDDVEQYTNLLLRISAIVGQSMKLWVVFKHESQWRFNRIEKYYGIWRKLTDEGIVFRNCLNEFILSTPVGEIIQTAAKIELCEIPLLFNTQHIFNSVWFWIPSSYSNDCNGSLCDIDSVGISVKDLLIKNAIIIDYRDYSSEGNSLFLKAKKGNLLMKVIMDDLGIVEFRR